MPNFPKFVYRFKQSPVKTPAHFAIDTDKLILKFTLKDKDIRIA